MEQYNDKYILYKIIDYKYTFHDLSPKLFPQLREGAPMYCPFHENSHTGTMQARIYFNEEKNLWYLHCYAEQKNFYAHDFVNLIMIRERQQFKSVKDFLQSRMGKEEFQSLYTLFKQKKQALMESQFKKKCAYIDNVYNEKGNTIDYIEALYTA